MPKVTYGSDKHLEQPKRAMLQLVDYCMSLYGYTSSEQLAPKIGISETTLNRRRNKPEEFTLKEIVSLCRLLKVAFKLPEVTVVE